MTAAQPLEPKAPGPDAVVARELTAAGIARALRFLADVRADPAGPPSPPRELLFHNRYSRAFANAPTLEPRSFATRRDVGEYLSPKLAPIKRQIVDRASFWSWLGIFYFEGTVRVVDGAARLSLLNETLVIDRSNPTANRNMHHHYLRAAWSLFEVYGEEAAFLLNQAPAARGGIANRILQSQRIFNSTGLVSLILRLYTHRGRNKRGFTGRPGGLLHLLRVLDQLERTHDVYHMSPDALIRILPPEFDPWIEADKNGATGRQR